MNHIRYRTEFRIIEVQVPIPFSLGKPRKLKPAKKPMRSYRKEEQKDLHRLREMYMQETENGTKELPLLRMFTPVLPLREGSTTKYKRYSDLPETQEILERSLEGIWNTKKPST